MFPLQSRDTLKSMSSLRSALYPRLCQPKSCMELCLSSHHGLQVPFCLLSTNQLWCLSTGKSVRPVPRNPIWFGVNIYIPKKTLIVLFSLHSCVFSLSLISTSELNSLHVSLPYLVRNAAFSFLLFVCLIVFSF